MKRCESRVFDVYFYCGVGVHDPNAVQSARPVLEPSIITPSLTYPTQGWCDSGQVETKCPSEPLPWQPFFSGEALTVKKTQYSVHPFGLKAFSSVAKTWPRQTPPRCAAPPPCATAETRRDGADAPVIYYGLPYAWLLIGLTKVRAPGSQPDPSIGDDVRETRRDFDSHLSSWTQCEMKQRWSDVAFSRDGWLRDKRATSPPRKGGEEGFLQCICQRHVGRRFFFKFCAYSQFFSFFYLLFFLFVKKSFLLFLWWA